MPVLVDFWAPWCGPCRMVSPLVERLGRENAGRLKVVKLNVDEAPAISARFGVQGIPLLVLIEGGSEADRLVGAAPLPQLQAWLAPHLPATGEPSSTAEQAERNPAARGAAAAQADAGGSGAQPDGL